MTYEVIQRIVKASGAMPGEKILVHFWGDDKDKSIANNFITAVASLGATPILLQQSREINKEIFSNAKESSFSDKYFEFFSAFDAVLDIFTYQPIILGYDIEPEQFAIYKKYIASLFAALMKSKRFAQIRIPTVANAEESGLDPEDYIARMTLAFDVDYGNIKSNCINKLKELENISDIEILTGTDCKVHFDITGRTWHIDAGDGDMPCGEIYIAPHESKTNGAIYFEKLFVEDVGKYENIVITIKDGLVISASNEELSAYFNKLPKECKTVCELGFGMNPNINSLCGYTVLDEKMCNTFHIAIGANNMFGGKNKAPIHIDFVCSGVHKII